jgi:hypothetical protein
MNRAAIFWAVSSQMIWLPLLFMDSQDRLISKSRDYDFRSVAKLPNQNLPVELGEPVKTLASGVSSYQKYSTTDKVNTGILLNSANHYRPGLVTYNFKNSSSHANSPSALSFSSILSTTASSNVVSKLSVKTEPLRHSLTSPSTPRSTLPLIRQFFSRSEILGGTLTLRDLDEPAIPPLAMAERARWSRTGDPLAPLPDIWREPMRKALTVLTKDAPLKTNQGSASSSLNQSIDSARMVHVPSHAIRRSTQVPLALQADGTVDILNQPDDPAIVDEIKRWSIKQKPPAPGRVSPAVVHLHAFPEEAGRRIDIPKRPTTTRFGQSSSNAIDLSNPSPLPATTSVTTHSRRTQTVAADPAPSVSTTAPAISHPSSSTPAPTSPQASESRTTPPAPVAEAPPPVEVSAQNVAGPDHPSQSAEVGQ